MDQSLILLWHCPSGSFSDNAGGGSGDGLNPTIFTTNAGPEPVFRLERSFIGTQSHPFQIGSKISRFVLTLDPFTDENPPHRFLAGIPQVLQTFNYYRLVHAEFCYFISACYSSQGTGNGNWNPGGAILRIAPWTGDFVAGSIIPTVAPDLLSRCQRWVCNVEPNASSGSDRPNRPTQWKRQAKMGVCPQYKQDEEGPGSSQVKANWNSSWLQIYSGIGRDPTRWHCLFGELTSWTENTATAVANIFLPYIVKYTIEFAGRRMLPPSITDKATYWAITTWERDLTQDQVLSLLSQMGPVVTSINGSNHHRRCK